MTSPVVACVSAPSDDRPAGGSEELFGRAEVLAELARAVGLGRCINGGEDLVGDAASVSFQDLQLCALR